MWRALLLSLFLVSFAQAQPLSAPKDVSLISLIAAPSAHDGQRIRVVGYLNFEFEGDQLYVGKADFDAGIYANSLWVERPKWIDGASARRHSRRYARLEGTFHAGPSGHLGFFAGSIEDVRRIEPWPSRTQFATRYSMPPWQEYRLSLVAAGLFVLLVTAGAHVLSRRGRKPKAP